MSDFHGAVAKSAACLCERPGAFLRGASALLFLAGWPVAAASGEPQRGSYQAMDYGPVISETIEAKWPEGNHSMKGLAIRLGEEAGMIFDTDLLRWASATRGWVDLSSTAHTRYKGAGAARTEGDELFGTAVRPGWARHGRFDDLREANRGNLPRDWARYRGFYRSGDRILLHYTVGDEEVLELPRAFEAAGHLVFARSLRLSGEGQARQIYVCELPEETSVQRLNSDTLILQSNGSALLVGLAGMPPGAALIVRENTRVECFLPAGRIERPIHLFLSQVEEGKPAGAVADQARDRLETDAVNFAALRRGGPSRWPEEVGTTVEISNADEAYVTDRIGLPNQNPWNSWIRPAGFDFFADGNRAALSTWNGDVWIVSGLATESREVRWRRFAAGLFYPLGLVVVDEIVHVVERGQLTRLHDLNGDGEADYYENVNNDGFVYPAAHALCLEVDSKGNFYFFKNGNRVPGNIPEHGALIRVSADGGRREVFASGIRGANTLAIGPGDEIMAADQQGDWVPTSRVDRIRQGGYYGYPAHGPEGVEPHQFEPPVCWIPHGIDNSSGALTFAGDERWGPLAGHWILGSYGSSRLLLLLTEEIGGRPQGGVAPFPLKFSSGLLRSRISPADGQLYLIGLKGWGTAASEDGSFDRVRYTGGPNRMPVGLNVSPRGLRLTFTEPLDERAVRADDFEVERWQYQYSSSYGSPEFSVENPEEKGRDPVEVASVNLSPDRREVYLDIPDIKRVAQMMVAYRLRFADGAEVSNAVYHTIHKLSESDEDRVGRRVARREVEETPPVEAMPSLGGAPEADPAKARLARGRQAFETHCASCHQPAGQGGVAPPMPESKWIAGPEETLLRIVLQGKQGKAAPMMPFAWLDDEQLADLLSFLRQQYHGKESISPGTIRRVRGELNGRTQMWTDEELERFLRENR